MYHIRFIVWFCQILLEDNTDRKIAASIVLGMFLGLEPLFSLQWGVGLVLACLFRFNVGTLIGSALTFFGLAQLLNPVFHAIGSHLLTRSGRLIPLWTWMYHAPLIPYTQFNHTIVLGASVMGVIFSLPIYFASKFLLKRYRASIYHAWRTTKLYRTYVVYKQYAR